MLFILQAAPRLRTLGERFVKNGWLRQGFAASRQGAEVLELRGC